MEYNVIDSVWYNTIGIVWVKTEYDGVKAYIGIGSGLDQKADEQHIAAWGQTFDAAYLGHLDTMHKEMEK